MAKIDRLFRKLVDMGGSDLHILAGQPPKFRVHGALEAVSSTPLANAECEELLYEILDPRRKQIFLDTMDVDFAYELKDVSRFRCNYLRQQHGVGAVFRTIPTKIRTLEELGVPETCYRFTEIKSGLVLVTGPTGSGKSTTLAAIINHINLNYRRHIVTIEDPIEYTHQSKMSIITQREVGEDAASFSSALRAAMREDPDAILVGELRDLETISHAITAAEMGIVVFATLHTNSAAKTIDRVIDVFPEEQQEQVRTMLSVSLQGVVSQLLLRRADGQGRAPANEILLGSAALANIIREGEVAKINQYIEGGRKRGMQLMDDSIMGHLEAGAVTPKEAYMKALDKHRFEAYMDDEII
ncbi:MAG: type IV pilus twitching motility protein PilT [Planctomycetota bacterium]|jgi:twitching motility protein PilT